RRAGMAGRLAAGHAQLQSPARPGAQRRVARRRPRGAAMNTARLQPAGRRGYRATLGMWVFLGTEVLFIGPLFVAYAALRLTHSDTFDAAARLTDLTLGTLNTGILLTSSFAMASAAAAGREAPRLARRLL